MPTTLLRGRPLVFCSAQTMASSGLVTQMTKASGAYLRSRRQPAPSTFEVDLEEIVAAHAGFPRHAGGDDHHIGVLDLGIFVGALDFRAVFLDRGGLRQVERLALRHAVDHVEQHHFAEVPASPQDEQACRRSGLRRSVQSGCEPWFPLLNLTP